MSWDEKALGLLQNLPLVIADGGATISLRYNNYPYADGDDSYVWNRFGVRSDGSAVAWTGKGWRDIRSPRFTKCLLMAVWPEWTPPLYSPLVSERHWPTPVAK